MKRSLSVLIACLMLLGLCATAFAADAAPITFWSFQASHVTFFESMAEKWNAENPDRPIELTTLTLTDADMWPMLFTALQSGSGAPDIVDIEINKYQNALKGDIHLLPLNKIVEPELENIVQARVNIYAKNGNYYGIDFHVGAEVMYYNMDIMNAAGIDPATLTTWEKYYEAGKKVLEVTGKPMCTVETGDSWSQWPIFSIAGSDFFNAEGEVTLDNETNIAICEYLQKLVKEGVAVIAPGGYQHTEEYYAFFNDGGAASVWMPLWYLNRFTDYMTDLNGKIKIYPAPAWTEGGYRSAIMGGTGTSITDQAKDPDLCMEFLSYCKLENEGNKEIWKQLGFDPIRIETWSDPVMQEPNKFTEYYQQDIFAVLLEVKDEFNDIYMTEMSPTMENLLETDGWNRIFVGMEEPAAVLKEIADLIRMEME